MYHNSISDVNKVFKRSLNEDQENCIEVEEEFDNDFAKPRISIALHDQKRCFSGLKHGKCFDWRECIACGAMRLLGILIAVRSQLPSRPSLSSHNYINNQRPHLQYVFYLHLRSRACVCRHFLSVRIEQELDDLRVAEDARHFELVRRHTALRDQLRLESLEGSSRNRLQLQLADAVLLAERLVRVARRLQRLVQLQSKWME